MIRPDSVLHSIPSAKWTGEEAFLHLRRTFSDAVDQRPDLMEPYLIRLEGLDERDQMRVMQEGLRETFARRYPSSSLRRP